MPRDARPAPPRPPRTDLDVPQLASNDLAVVSSVEWLFEPCWHGDRLMARLHDGRVRLTDRTGSEPAGYDELVGLLPDVIDADQALLDGVWTSQPFIGVGSAAAHLAEALEEEGLTGTVPDPRETERARAFVVIDLVELDGQGLHDVPYLERRRLLEAIVRDGPQIRVTPAVKRPVEHWIAAWRANGFTHYVAKHQNSTYRPGERIDDWVKLSAEPEMPPSIFGRLFGQRPRRVRHIADRPDRVERGRR
jgi:bifunctional non-homologous end joining protein LigD